MFPAGQLANDPKAVEQLQLGGIDLTVTGTGTYATHIPTLNLMLMPYLVDTYDQGWQLYDDSAWLKKQFDQGPSKGFRIPRHLGGRLPLDDHQGPAQLARGREGQEAAHLPERDAALAARGDGLLDPDPADDRGLPRDPAERGVGAGEPDRHDLRQQVLRGRAERDAHAARLQPDSADDLREDLAEALARRPRGRERRRRARLPTGSARRSARTTTASSPT